MLGLNYTIGSYWSWPSMFFFIILSLLTMYVFYGEKKNEGKLKAAANNHRGIYILGFLLLVFAVFRLVNNYTGGADARTYIFMFDHSNDPGWQTWDWFLHQDLAFRYFTKSVRFISSDHHVYFFFVYTLMIFAGLYFLRVFLPQRTSVIPVVLFIFLYWRGFSTIRSNSAVALMCIALVLLYKNKWKWAILLTVLSCLTHKMAIPYAMFLPFYWVFRRYNLRLWHVACLIALVYVVSRYTQQFFISEFAEHDLGGSYVSYASNSLGGSFFDNYWKIAFEQLFLATCMLLFNQKMKKEISHWDQTDASRIRFIWYVVVFDIICIPLSYVMGIWRSAEFFYLARIVMWNMIVYLAGKSFVGRTKIIYDTVCLLGFLAWMTFRFYSTWEDSQLMPYVFEPLM